MDTDSGQWTLTVDILLELTIGHAEKDDAAQSEVEEEIRPPHCLHLVKGNEHDADDGDGDGEHADGDGKDGEHADGDGDGGDGEHADGDGDGKHADGDDDDDDDDGGDAADDDVADHGQHDGEYEHKYFHKEGPHYPGGEVSAGEGCT